MIRIFSIALGALVIAACDSGMDSLKGADCTIAVKKYIEEVQYVMEINKEVEFQDIGNNEIQRIMELQKTQSDCEVAAGLPEPVSDEEISNAAKDFVKGGSIHPYTR
mgnify:CR=1 FL=1